MKTIIEEEKEYLEYAKKSLEEEKQYCEKELLEIPKRHTNVLQGDSFLVEGLMSTQATKLRKLQMAEKTPYFGRIDFLSDGTNEVAKIYIGKTNIIGDNNKPVVTDWRTPICNLYYDNEIGRVSYHAPCGIVDGQLELKRQILIENGEVVDVLDTSLVSNDELLQPYLSVNADNKMKTIIASIQKEQNKIIRKPINENIIVQGVAGSGKTSVALHRIAYLVYNLGEQIKSNQFLVIGPNKYFLDYVSSILPELETEPVEQKTYDDLVNTIMDEKLTLETTDIFDSKISKDTLKNIEAYKSSLDYKKALDDFMFNYLKYDIVTTGFNIDGEEVYSAEKIRSVLVSDNGNLPNFESACNYFVKDFKDNIENIYFKINKKYEDIYMSLPKDDPNRKEALKNSEELRCFIKEKGVKNLRDYFKKIKLKPLDIYKLFIANLDKYEITLSEMEILNLQKITLEKLKKKKISFDDLPALMHLNFLLKGKNNDYRHIVIDEAQDYGLFHFNALKEMYPNSTFSIYGDLAQSIYSYRSIKDWESVVKQTFNDDCEILNLNKSYRTTIEVTENANKVLETLELDLATPVIRHGENINYSDSSKDNNYKYNKLLEWIKKGYKSIAVICKTDKEAKNTYEILKKLGLDITNITAKETEYNGGVFVLTSALSKGLEFDAVMLNDASENIYNPNSKEDMHLLYVACTRSLHELEILYNQTLCEVLENKKVKKLSLNK